MSISNTTTEILHEASWGFIEYMPDVPCLRCVIRGFSLSEEVKSRHNKLLELLEEKMPLHQNKIGLLTDTGKAEPLLEIDIKWLMEDWTPRLSRLDARYIAVVIPENEWAQTSVEAIREMMEEADNGLTQRYFKDDQLALAWLRDVVNN
ncbi:hypothetical protein [Ohtaekwangia koreensis]|uniref:SpoIIAA-like n=1 Tax=Ohtaekwangia koreensis TaxID=688867 RepID=A0A1T5JMZ7_9BACT|nr:hypothetical protein [Ohtaekwangia koreensis]SKC52771.1 hypothetical protein SAMN05660236_1280 [Ohtaekwangia koreensis]